MLVVRPDAPLFYANAQAVRDAIEAAVIRSDGAVTAVIVDLDANDELDVTSADQLDKLADTVDVPTFGSASLMYINRRS